MDEQDEHPDLAHLPGPERAAMRRLRDWLEMGWREEKRWLAVPSPGSILPWPEVVCLMAGLDPGASEGREAERLEFFPGVREAWGLPTISENLALEFALETEIARFGKMISLLEQKTGLPADLSPLDALKAAESAGLSVPWLEAALADPFCRDHLQPLLSEGVNESGTAGADTLQPKSIHELGGQARWAGNSMKIEGLALGERMVAEGHDRKSIAEEIEDTLEVSRSTAYRWLKELTVPPVNAKRGRRLT
ncbi:MAG: hypothetical protein JJT81_15525 [Rubellimicrobium sp.]|nr:hypothetical protein [Rubellimicrobium sp.]